MNDRERENSEIRRDDPGWDVVPPKPPERTKLGRLLAFFESLAGSGNRHHTDGQDHRRYM